MALTENLYTGDGSTVLYSFTFPYIETEDVKVSINGVNTTAYSLATATTIEFNTAPGTSDNIRIYRDTPIDDVTAQFFPGSVIRAQDLNDNFEQTLFIAQETLTKVDAADAVQVADQAARAETKADQAISTANQAAVDVNNALIAGDNISELNNDVGYVSGDVVTRVIAGNNITVTNNGVGDVVVASTASGGSGGGDTINIEYGTVAAWGVVQGNGTLTEGLNCTTVRNSSGSYTVTFNTPMPSSDYAITTGNMQANSIVEIVSQDANGFNYLRKEPSSGTLTDLKTSFAVHALNALPPQGGTGADAWGTTAGVASLSSSFNIASVAAVSGTARYQWTFTTPMPDANYAVIGTSTSSSADKVNVYVYDRTTTGFKTQTFQGASGVAAAHAVVVHATNATLPQSFTQEQVNAAINNPGVSAWGTVGLNGGLIEGLNVASATNPGVGTYDVVFATPMPNANYSVVVSPDDLSNTNAWSAKVSAKTATGFSYGTYVTTTGSNSGCPVSFVVTATNNVPPKGGTGADAWAYTSANGTVNASSNLSCSAASNVFTYTFNTPMPDSAYAVVAAVQANSITGFLRVRNQTTTGFEVISNEQSGATTSSTALNHSVVVHATNAVLPATITTAQLAGITSGNVVLASDGSATFADTLDVGGNGISYDGGTSTHKFSYEANAGGKFLWTANGGTPHPMCRSYTGTNVNFRWDGSSTLYGNLDNTLEVIIGTSSDYRMKENVSNMPSTWDLIKGLRPVTYEFIDSDQGVKHGFIAHEVQEAGLPDGASGHKDAELMQSINPYPIVAALTKALQEAMERIEQLENK